MTRKELSEKIGYAENTIKKNFNRVLFQVQKNQGLTILKEGRGQSANYTLVPFEGEKPERQKVDYAANMIGQQFGHLTVIEDSGERSHRAVLWKCKCDCGNEKKFHFISFKIRSC